MSVGRARESFAYPISTCSVHARTASTAIWTTAAVAGFPRIVIPNSPLIGTAFRGSARTRSRPRAARRAAGPFPSLRRSRRRGAGPGGRGASGTTRDSSVYSGFPREARARRMSHWTNIARPATKKQRKAMAPMRAARSTLLTPPPSPPPGMPASCHSSWQLRRTRESRLTALPAAGGRTLRIGSQLFES